MIVWSGRGFLIPLVLIASFMFFMEIIPMDYVDAVYVLTFLSTAIFSWFVGKKWNGVPGKVMIDKESGQEVVYKPNHSFFFIKMQYWGIVLGIISIYTLITSF